MMRSWRAAVCSCTSANRQRKFPLFAVVWDLGRPAIGRRDAGKGQREYWKVDFVS